MNCAYHPGQPVQGVCSTCGRPICDHCLVDLNGQVHCKSCLESKMRKPARDVNGGARFILSVFPGLGHLYMGLFQRGIQFLVTFIGGSIILGNLFDELVGFFVAAMIFYSIFDAREAHMRISQGLEVEDRGFVDVDTLKLKWEPKYIGYILIGIGGLVLFNTLVNDVLQVFFPQQWYALRGAIRGTFTGVLAIGGGVWLLQRNSGNSRS